MDNNLGLTNAGRKSLISNDKLSSNNPGAFDKLPNQKVNTDSIKIIEIVPVYCHMRTRQNTMLTMDPVQ